MPKKKVFCYLERPHFSRVKICAQERNIVFKAKTRYNCTVSCIKNGTSPNSEQNFPKNYKNRLKFTLRSPKRVDINELVRSVDAQDQTLLVDCLSLDSGSNVNSSFILHTVNKILRQL